MTNDGPRNRGTNRLTTPLTRFAIRSMAVLALFVSACASKPVPMEAPHWTEVPRSAVEAFCSRFHDEGISSETTINVVKVTQPLVTANALRSLAEAALNGGRIDANKVAAAVAAASEPIPVAVPTRGCSWRGIDPSSRRAIDILTLEVSAPFVNPFARSSSGLLARLSLAGQGTTWYWLPVAQRGPQVMIGTPLPLSIRE